LTKGAAILDDRGDDWICADTGGMLRRSAKAQIIVHGLLHPGFGPLVRVEVVSNKDVSTRGLAVLDTGASKSAIDGNVARRLELPSPGVASWLSVSADDAVRPMSPLRRASIGLMGTSYVRELDFIEAAALQEKVSGFNVLVLLGWDFLMKCRLSCDGPAGTFTLEVPRPKRRRR
jgi:hypothetical protein